MKKLIPFIITLFFGTQIMAQVPDYLTMAFDSNANFYTIRDSMRSYYDSTGLDTVRGSGYKQFNRWEAFWSTRVGDSTNHGSFAPAFKALAALGATSTICNGGPYNDHWTHVGHESTESSGYFSKGQGILLKVHVDLTHHSDGSVIYVGSPTGGLWRTTNANASPSEITWECLTDKRYPGMGVNDIAIDPNNEDVMYISTGVGIGDEMSYGQGLLKTTNGTDDAEDIVWNVCLGASYDPNNPYNLRSTQGVFICPTDPTIVIAFMKDTILKSTNSGASFSPVYRLGTNRKRYFRDLVFIPNSNTIFVSSNDKNIDDGGAVVLKSDNNGDTWTDVTSSLHFANDKDRIDLAITPANESLIVAIGGTYDKGQNISEVEMSKSTNGGGSWSSQAQNVTINTSNGNGSTWAKIQYWQSDLAISPQDEDVMYIGGTIFYKSVDGGQSFDNAYDYVNQISVHPDVRDLDIGVDALGNDIIYSANDGGLNIGVSDISDQTSNGTSWTNCNGTGLNITQIYGFDMNLKRDWITIGCQDLGLYNYDDGPWLNYEVGDGGRIIYDPFINPEKMWAQNQALWFLFYSVDRGTNWLDDADVNSHYVSTNWEKRKMKFDALGNLYQSISFGGGELYRRLRSNTNNASFSLIEDFPSQATDFIWGIGISKSGPDTIYVGFNQETWSSSNANRLYKTTDALNSDPTFTGLTPSGLNLGGNGISDIVVDPNNSAHVWVVTGTGFLPANGTGHRIYYSSDGGANFATVDQGLNLNSTTPMIFPVNVMVLDEATGGMYVGTDVGVYYNPNPKNTSSSWVCFNEDLPTTIVTDLKIDYCHRTILASTFGRGLWESALAEEPDVDYEITSPYLLNIEPEETRIFYSDITIPSGYTMTVEGLVRMAPGRKITVRPGAKLKIDGGEINVTCESFGYQWEGVKVEGTSNQSQFALDQNNRLYQGFVEIIDGTITNAKYGVSFAGLLTNGEVNWNKTGGIIQATGAKFINNKRDIEFLSYHPKNGSGLEIVNRSFFSDCEFLTTDALLIASNKLDPNVVLFDVNGVRFMGCKFQDTRNINPQTQGRVGIHTLNSNYSVTNLCTYPYTYPACTGNPSEFINLKRAIQSYSNGSMGVISIHRSEFTSYSGVFLQNIRNALVRANTFTIAHIAYDPDIAITNYPFGLYLDGCHMFNTEGNEFIGISGTANRLNGGAAGLVIRNTWKGNNNVFYRSYFDDLKIGSQIQGINRTWSGERGLRFRCNEYHNNYFDLDVRNAVTNPFSYPRRGGIGMAENQGLWYLSPPLNPDNQFGNTASVFYNINNRGQWMSYPYNGAGNSSNRFYPNWVNLIAGRYSVSRVPNPQSESCSDLINGWGTSKQSLITSLNTIGPNMVLASSDLDNLVDGGSTKNLTDTIRSANTSNIPTIMNQLLSASPYLSNEVLVLVASQNQPFTDEMILNVMLANPHSARSFWVQEVLDDRSNPLPASYRDSIDNLDSVFTNRDTLLAELAAHSYSYDLKLTELLQSYMSDTVSQLLAVSQWLKHPLNPAYHYQLAELYFDNNDTTACNGVLDSITIKFDLDSLALCFHSKFKTLYTKLKDWKKDSVNIWEPDSNRMAWMLNFANSDTILPGKIHALLAVNDTFIIQPDVYIPDTADPNNSPFILFSEEEIRRENQHSEINVYPNPTDNIVSIEWKGLFKEAEVMIFDIRGNLVSESKWNNGGTLKLIVSNWPAGMYFISVATSSKEKINRKLVIKH